MFDLFFFAAHGLCLHYDRRSRAAANAPVRRLVGRARISSGERVWVRPDFSLTDCPRPDIVCIPDFYVDPGQGIAGLHNAEARWLKHAHGEGAMLASACSGAWLIGQAGLLSNCEARIHWGYVASFRQQLSRREGEGPAIVGVEWEAQRIVMAGGGSSSNT